MKPLRALLPAALLLCAGHALAHGGLTDVSVYDRTEGRRLQVYWHEGRGYVVGKPGNEYQVSLRNRQREEVLAVVSVDGINVITGQTADASQSGYVLSPRGALEIQGWRRSLSQTAAFYFTSLPDSYAARTGRPNDVGVIGVALFRKKFVAPPVPYSSAPEPTARSRAAERSSAGSAADSARPAAPQLGTGHGRHETSPAYHVQFERATSAPAEVITLYYDSHANLVAKGVIRHPVPVAPLPRPFPGFVPDPQG
jgi:hypothetical protein